MLRGDWCCFGPFEGPGDPEGLGDPGPIAEPGSGVGESGFWLAEVNSLMLTLLRLAYIGQGEWHCHVHSGVEVTAAHFTAWHWRGLTHGTEGSVGSLAHWLVGESRER